MKETQEILERTRQLFEEISKLNSDEEKQPFRTEIFLLNHKIIENEMSKRCGIYNDMISYFYDDMYSAITEALWTAICRYDISKGANLYTFATPYINDSCSDVVRSYVTKDTLSKHEFRQFCKMRDMANSGMSREDIKGEFGKSGLVVKRLWPLVTGNVFPMESDVALVSATQRENGYKTFENREWISHLYTACEDEYDEWLFWRTVDGELITDMLMARTFHISRDLSMKYIQNFHRKLRKAHEVYVGYADKDKKGDFETVLQPTQPMPETTTPEIVILKEGGDQMKIPVPEDTRKQSAVVKIDTSIDLGVRKYIDDRVKEKIDEMSVGEIVDIVLESLNKNKKDIIQ